VTLGPSERGVGERVRGVGGRLRRLAAAAREFAVKTLRIARWELTRSAGTLDRRTILLGLAGVLLVGLVAPAAMGGSAALDEGIYRVGVDEENPYYPVVEESSAFRPVAPDEAALNDSEMELLIEGSTVQYNSSIGKSEAALSEFASAVEAYNYETMQRETNRTAAFPVVVDLRYEERPPLDRTISAPDEQDGTANGDAGGGSDGAGTDGDGGDTDGGSGDGSSDGTNGSDDGSGSTGSDGSGSTGSDGSGGGGDGGSDGGSGDGSSDGTNGGAGAGADGGTSGGGGLLGSALGGGSTGSSPAEISPPFPMQSLVLAFLFIVPMNFVIQLYGGSIMNERINRRGELMLVAPVGRSAIVAGKTLPYLAALTVVSTAIALAIHGGWPIDGGWLSVAAVVPLAVLFLAAAFVGAMFSRSFKELTFVTVTISVGLSSYAFVPAIFTNVTPIALISPLTLVVWDLQGEAVTAAEYAFSAGPPLLIGALLFGLGVGVYREEDMFSQRAVHLKAMDALANYARTPRSVFAVTALSIPFVLLAELLAIAILFALPLELSAPVLLLSISLIEELAKSLHVYAGFAHNRWAPTLRSAAIVGAASGAGFFVAEKAMHVVSVVGITTLDLGRIAFPESAASYDAPVAVAMFFLPLALHVVTAIVSAVGARRGRWHYAATLSLAIALHTLYNLGVTNYVA